MRPNIIRIMMAAGTLCLGGCLNPDTWSYKSEYDPPQLLAVAGPVTVDITSFNGDVFIVTDPRNTFGSVRVRRRATHGYGRGSEARDALEHVKYSMVMEHTESGPVLKVNTWTEDVEPHFLRADLRIRLPSLGAVTVRTQNGFVEAYGFDGPINIETTDGRVHLETGYPIVQPVTITNKRGDIDYQVAGGSSGRFECQAVDGEVEHRMRIGRVIVLPGTDHDTLLATLNDGENPVQLRTSEGDIRIAVVNIAPDTGSLTVSP
jgi:putative adhesin